MKYAIIFMTISFFGQCCYSQKQIPDWINDYDTLKSENLKIEYTNDSGTIFIIPFKVQDSILNYTFNDRLDSTMEFGGSMVGWFNDPEDYTTPLYYKCYGPTQMDFSFAWNSIYMSQSICFYSYKNISELAYLGVINSRIRIRYNDIVICDKTTLADFKEYFPNSYASGMDSTKSPYNFQTPGQNELTFLMRINIPKIYWERISENPYEFGGEDPIRSNCIVIKFRNGLIYSFYRQLGT